MSDLGALYDAAPAPAEQKPAATDLGALYDAAPAPKPKPSWFDSATRALGQGLTLGWGDEGAAALAATIPALDKEAAQGGTWQERYAHARDTYRGLNREAEKANPVTYLAGNVAGSLPTLAASGAGLLSAAGQGAAQGAGYSDASGQQLASDSALGGALGVAGFGVGKALGAAGDALARRGDARAVRGAARAASLAADEATAPVNSLEGAARERAANAYRQVERVNLLLADPALPAAERTALEAFKQSPEYAALVQANAKGVLTQAPEALAEREAARTVAAQARADLPQAIQAKTAELSQPQVREDIKSFLKSYAEPVIWATAGGFAANESGLPPWATAAASGAAGLIGGRTRAGKALWNRVNRPGNMIALGHAMESAGGGISGAAGTVGRAVTTGLTSSGVSATQAPIWSMLQSGQPPEGLEPKYASMLQGAAQRGGTDGLAAAHFVLWNTDPGYQAATKEATKDGESP